MYPRKLKERLKFILQNGIDTPVIILGPPGIGKSMIVAEVANELHWNIIDLRLLLLDPTDMRGIPAVVNNSVQWLRQPFLPTVERDGEKGILFLDEINLAPQIVQASSYQLLTNRRIGEYILPDGWRIIAAGNRHTDIAAVNRMPAPLINRFQFYYLEPSFEDWKIWAYENNVHPIVISFLNYRPSLIFEAPAERDTPFPTPRTWVAVSKLLSAMGELVIEDVAGSVGMGPANEFMAFLMVYKDLPSSPEDILRKNITFKSLDRQFAINGMLVEYFRTNRDKDPNIIESIIKYAIDIPAEASVTLVRDCMSISAPEVIRAASFGKWSAKYAKYTNTDYR